MLAHASEVYDKLGDHLKSDSLLSLVINANPNYAFAHYAKGKILLARGAHPLLPNILLFKGGN